MANLAKFRQDPEKAQDGVWFDWEGGIELLIARTGNPKFQEWMAKRKGPQARRLRRGRLSEEEQTRLMKAGIAATVLNGWKNLELPVNQAGEPVVDYEKEGPAVMIPDPEHKGDGDAPLVEKTVPVEFDRKLCARILMHPDYEVLYQDVVLFSNDSEAFRADFQGDVVGNS